MRAWILTVFLLIASTFVVVGVSFFSVGAAWIVAGVLLAGLAVLNLAEVTG